MTQPTSEPLNASPSDAATQLRCGIIGFGKMGKTRAHAIEQSGKGKVVAVFDTADVSGCGYDVVEDEAAIINHPSIDAVFICTPNFRIAPLCKQALAAGKHVFSEKPPAFNAREVEEVREVESASGKTLMYGFNHRHHGSIKKMKEIVDSGEMGKILWMRGRYGKEVDGEYFKGWRADPKLAGGGIMLDQGIHMLDLFLHFAGEFDEIHSLVSNLFWETEGLEDNVFSIMKNSQTGVCASLHSTMTQWRYLFSLEVFLEKGALVLNGLKTSSGVYGDEDLAIKHNDLNRAQGQFESEEHIIFHTDTSWSAEVTQFFAAILNGTPVQLGNSEDALRLMQAMDRIYENK
ncbi:MULTISPECIES: Gfo/Idh/MocA family protein [unclassified Lentimonas]|uniref:Gfo/Idh/MocA family protein n=1 Tax=unclassified Lentimonas TaxID=2630993 RepID=UPI0013269EC6|nr:MULTISPECIES: Gfo/Idh/MocA family oxidoreductase [unclassified Lentimonas]CAA6690189.1 L-fuco-beta-pyranose dehydrogenase (EC [Lentimonas sp. CC10]CAA6695978.1 L-fuco-beta-pyranose dehydrogenase (EC [Lentimonas sp. CC19]CAA7070225.1 L-fuco-beta-pyranose dehydrogenase (EC [Lentimonas sp. CC11]